MPFKDGTPWASFCPMGPKPPQTSESSRLFLPKSRECCRLTLVNEPVRDVLQTHLALALYTIHVSKGINHLPRIPMQLLFTHCSHRDIYSRSSSSLICAPPKYKKNGFSRSRRKGGKHQFQFPANTADPPTASPKQGSCVHLPQLCFNTPPMPKGPR